MMHVEPKEWREAVRRAGGVEAVAAKLGIARRTVFLWRSTGVPAERVADVAKVLDLHPAALRPDLAAAFAASAA